jgi:hypothetical protein
LRTTTTILADRVKIVNARDFSAQYEAGFILCAADQELLTAEYAENSRGERREQPNSLRTGAAEFFRFFPQALLP